MTDETVGVEIVEHPVHVGYGASQDGRVWSRYKRGGRGGIGEAWIIRKPIQNPLSGRYAFNIPFDRKTIGMYVSRFVLEVFVGECPAGQECCHVDGDKHNNRLENLRWDTHKNNEADKKMHGTHQRGENHGGSKLTEADAIEIRARVAAGEKQKTVADRFGIVQQHVSDIVCKKKWAHLR